MSDAYMRQSPLAQLGLAARAAADAGDAGVVLSERTGLGLANLRGVAADSAFLGACRAALGFALPLEPNTVAEGTGMRALWLGPDEWLVVDANGAAPAPVLRQALADLHAAATDVSDSRAVIGLAGPRARQVLAKGSPFDFHPRAFGSLRCAQTRLSRLAVVVEQRDDRPSYDLYVMRSMARYLWRWLEDAGAEYGTAVAPG